jgi:hypothetical protein
VQYNDCENTCNVPECCRPFFAYFWSLFELRLSKAGLSNADYLFDHSHV